LECQEIPVTAGGDGEAVRTKEIRLVFLPFLIPRWAAAQVLLPRRVFVKRGVRLTRRLLAHELVHVDQLRRRGVLGYWWAYLTLLLRYGYREHPLELDAIVRSAEPGFLDWASRLLAAHGERDSAGPARLSSGRPLDLR
jgi:hypothetical protein